MPSVTPNPGDDALSKLGKSLSVELAFDENGFALLRDENNNQPYLFEQQHPDGMGLRILAPMSHLSADPAQAGYWLDLNFQGLPLSGTYFAMESESRTIALVTHVDQASLPFLNQRYLAFVQLVDSIRRGDINLKPPESIDSQSAGNIDFQPPSDYIKI